MTSLILVVAGRTLFHTILAVSLWFLLVGHNAPGGGFIGGLVAGAAFVLRYLSGGREELIALRHLRPEPLLGAGVLLAASTGFAGFLVEGAFLGGAAFEASVPLLGKVKATTALPFDVGVYLVVVGVVLMLLDVLGPEVER